MSTANLHSKPPFINAIQLFMGVNEMRVKILPLLCRLGLVLRLGSVYFDVIGISSLGK